MLQPSSPLFTENADDPKKKADEGTVPGCRKAPAAGKHEARFRDQRVRTTFLSFCYCCQTRDKRMWVVWFVCEMTDFLA